MKKLITRHSLLLCLLSGSVPQLVYAEFVLNFQPQSEFARQRTYTTHSSTATPGQTPFLNQGGLELPEIVTDPNTGIKYYHLIIGDMADGYIQETYIEMGYRNFQGDSGSAVGGDGNSSGGNGLDPLAIDPGIITANAEASPKRVLVRQIVSDGEITMEYLKDKYDRKALINQSLSNSEINTEFSVDMRNSDYNDASTAGTIQNIVNIIGQAQAGFDMTDDIQNSNMNAGRYTYTDGLDYGGSDGSYNYVDGDYDHKSEKWDNYYDPSENNPWSYSDNKPAP